MQSQAEVCLELTSLRPKRAAVFRGRSALVRLRSLFFFFFFGGGGSVCDGL